jgi:hypothetical protein
MHTDRFGSEYVAVTATSGRCPAAKFYQEFAGITGYAGRKTSINVFSWRAGPRYYPPTRIPTMSLAPGSRLAAYEIVAAIGAGGPASARVVVLGELRRGLAEADVRTR